MLLAERKLLGYPGVTVELHTGATEGNTHRVLVRDPVRCVEWETPSRKEAKDMFFHPFCYGYNYSTQPEDDGA